MIGEGRAIDKEVLFNLRYTGISHILCVSGLHLSLVMIIIFTSSRFLLNISNYLAYNFDVKIIAACITLVGSFFYLLLSGVQIAATRAFFMTSIVLFGIMLNRVPDVLRTLNFSAFVILAQNPESVFHPSFQLSFIAVLSLVAGFEYYSEKVKFNPSNSYFHKIKVYVLANIYTSTVASVATAPIVIYHFYIFSNYSILANLVAVPITSIFVMPLAIAGLILMVFGLHHYIFVILGFFIGIIIDSAKYFISLPGSKWYFGFIEPINLLLYLFGFFIICFSKKKENIFAIIIIIISFILMLNKENPDIIFDSNKEILGTQNEKNELEIYSKKYNSFTQEYWANWFGLEKSKFYTRDTSQENIIFITKDEKKIIIITDRYKCQEADLFINNIDDRICRRSKQNLVKKDLENYGTIAVFCKKNKNNCKIQY